MEEKVCCKICERCFKEIIFEKHSIKCKERAEIKEKLLATKIKLIELIEKAHSLKTTLNTNVKIQK